MPENTDDDRGEVGHTRRYRAHITRNGMIILHKDDCRCDECGWVWVEYAPIMTVNWAESDELLTLAELTENANR